MLLKSIVWVQSAFANFDLRDEEGQTLVEYALIMVLVAIALTAALTALSGGISGSFTKVTNALK
jgi:Flp pilus assembly pilin Flp